MSGSADGAAVIVAVNIVIIIVVVVMPAYRINKYSKRLLTLFRKTKNNYY